MRPIVEGGLRLWYSTGDRLLPPVLEDRESVFAHTVRMSGKSWPFSFGEYDATLGWRPHRNLRGALIGGVPVTTNSHGVRSAREIPTAKPPGSLRIVAVGDSFTFGEESPDDEVWLAQIEPRIPGSTVINLGVTAYGTDQQLLMLRSEGFKYEPDIVLLGLFEEDINRNVLKFREYAKPWFELEDGRLALKGVPVPRPEEILDGFRDQRPLSFIVHLLRVRASARRLNRLDVRLGERIEEKLEVLCAILGAAAEECSAHGARLLVIFIPVDAIDNDARVNVRDRARTCSENAGAEFLDLGDDFYPLGEKGISPYDNHFNTLGNLVAARAVIRKLSASGWIPQPDAEAGEDLDRRIEVESRRMEADTDGLGSRAELALASGEYERARELYSKLLAANPGQEWHCTGAGAALLHTGRAEEAVAMLRRAVAFDPTDQEAMLYLGSAYLANSDTENALKTFREIIRSRPKFYPGYSNLSSALLGCGRAEEAEAVLREGVGLIPDEPRIHYALGSILVGNGKPEEGIASLRRSIELDASNPDAHFNAALIMIQAGDFVGAEARLEDAIRLSPQDPQARNQLGIARAAQGNLKGALESFSEALRIDPGFEQARQNLERVRSMSGDGR